MSLDNYDLADAIPVGQRVRVRNLPNPHIVIGVWMTRDLHAGHCGTCQCTFPDTRVGWWAVQAVGEEHFWPEYPLNIRPWED